MELNKPSLLSSLDLIKSPASAGFFIFICLCFLFSDWRVQQEILEKPRELVAPPAGLVHFHFGFRHAFADSLWVRSLQDFDYCEHEKARHLCQGRGWLFQTLDLVTDLDPKFRMAYSAGGMALTIIVNDMEGASRLFDKGVRQFPKDWVLLYKAAYQALQEEKNPEKAAALMERAAQNGAPDWVYVLSGRLYTNAGRQELAVRVLQEMQSLALGEKFQERLRQKLQEASEPSSP